eukprot:9970573-Lingulodinium_polyedra.AAC.1
MPCVACSVVSNLTEKTNIPMAIALMLKDLLPTDGLLPFLQQYPNFFEVTFVGKQNRKNKPMYIS